MMLKGGFWAFEPCLHHCIRSFGLHCIHHFANELLFCFLEIDKYIWKYSETVRTKRLGELSQEGLAQLQHPRAQTGGESHPQREGTACNLNTTSWSRGSKHKLSNVAMWHIHYTEQSLDWERGVNASQTCVRCSLCRRCVETGSDTNQRLEYWTNRVRSPPSGIQTHPNLCIIDNKGKEQDPLWLACTVHGVWALRLIQEAAKLDCWSASRPTTCWSSPSAVFLELSI